MVGPAIAESQVYARVHGAMQRRELVLGYLGGAWSVLCPHALGWHRGEAYALCYQLEGPPPPVDQPSECGKDWRWVRLRDFNAQATSQSVWFSTPRSEWPIIEGFQIEIAVD